MSGLDVLAYFQPFADLLGRPLHTSAKTSPNPGVWRSCQSVASRHPHCKPKINSVRIFGGENSLFTNSMAKGNGTRPRDGI